jgi:hypothetical protein
MAARATRPLQRLIGNTDCIDDVMAATNATLDYFEAEDTPARAADLIDRSGARVLTTWSNSFRPITLTTGNHGGRIATL